jgi:cobalt-zinc-cadmium efflux system outer membrane protein
MPHSLTAPARKLLVAAALLLSSLGAAQDGTRLPRAEALREALRHNAELRAERERLGVEEAELVRAGQLLPSNPQLGARLGTDGPFKNSGERLLEVELQQELEVAGQRGLRKTEAETRLRAARARVQALETRIAQEASGAWYRLWRAERQRALAGEALELARALDSAAESRFQAGDIPELERNVAAVDLTRAERATATLEAERARARLDLARVLGRTGARAPDIELEEGPLPELPSETLDALQALAREHRADLAAAKYTEDAAETRVRLRARERIPNPTLSVGYEREAQRIGALQDVDQHLFAGLSIPLPFWNRGQAELKAARAERGAAQVEREAAERQVDTEVASALAEVQQARKAVEALAGTLPRVKRNLELVRRAFEAGQLDLLSLLNARDRAQQAQQEYVEAQVEYGRALDELTRATGRLPREIHP